jgi:hypothetical protein
VKKSTGPARPLQRRLGLYEPIQRVVMGVTNCDPSSPALKVASAMLSGAAGATLGSPVYLSECLLPLPGLPTLMLCCNAMMASSLQLRRGCKHSRLISRRGKSTITAGYGTVCRPCIVKKACVDCFGASTARCPESCAAQLCRFVVTGAR